MNVQIPPTQAGQDLQPDDEDRGAGHALRRFLIPGMVLLVAVGGFWYYTSHQSGESAGGNRRFQGAPPVKVAVAQQRTMAVIERTIGTVVANSTVSVTARVQGQLTKAYFKEGQMVKQGDLLFQIDPAPFQAAYDAALATLASTKSNADRSAALLKQNAIAPQVDDNNQAAYLQAKANAEAARLNLQFTQIHSPINGKTGPILLQPGNLVSVNGITAPLVSITEVQPIKVSFALPQADLPRIQARAKTKEGLNAVVKLHDAGGDQDLSAPVNFISNAVVATSGTIELRASFPNTDLALVPGQLVDVVVDLASIPNAIVVPREAVNQGPNGPYVYVVEPEESIAQMQPVKIAFDDGVDAAVVGNVHDGDQVIVDGQLRVIPGGKVSIPGQGQGQGSEQGNGGAFGNGQGGGNNFAKGGRGRRGGNGGNGGGRPQNEG
ncbi:MAG TPA: efflux RND transporter periplasmic adaptor subunit [Rhizomicrobium sp.]|nr:efflux RND transporter periplasmic adaptor subunit [Rhizomicrobium sp.]